MRALTFVPGVAGSARLDEVEDPDPADGPVVVDALALGICGTDKELAEGHLGWLSPGWGRMILGHESLGRVREAPTGCGLEPGDPVVGIVRRPDPGPCPECAAGDWDLCRTAEYTERGIKRRGGFGAERFRIEPEFAVKVDPSLGLVGVLVEPASVLAKAWEAVDRFGARASRSPRRLLVTGAGPIGLLAAWMGARRGMEVHVLDRATDGVKPSLVRDLGATYHTGSIDEAARGADVVMECAGAGELAVGAIRGAAPNGIVCLIGNGCGERPMATDWGQILESMVVRNLVVFGTVSANRRHYERAAAELAAGDREWLGRLITRRVPLGRWSEALEGGIEDVKSVVLLGE